MTKNNRKQLINSSFEVLDVLSLLRAEGVSCSLDVLYEGRGISKLQVLILKIYLKNLSCIFSIFSHQNSGSGLGTGSVFNLNAGSGCECKEYGSITLPKGIGEL